MKTYWIRIVEMQQFSTFKREFSISASSSTLGSVNGLRGAILPFTFTDSFCVHFEPSDKTTGALKIL